MLSIWSVIEMFATFFNCDVRENWVLFIWNWLDKESEYGLKLVTGGVCVPFCLQHLQIMRPRINVMCGQVEVKMAFCQLSKWARRGHSAFIHSLSRVMLCSNQNFLFLTWTYTDLTPTEKCELCALRLRYVICKAVARTFFISISNKSQRRGRVQNRRFKLEADNPALQMLFSELIIDTVTWGQNTSFFFFVSLWWFLGSLQQPWI